MFQSSSISFSSSGILNKLVKEYLEKKESVKKFYAEFPDESGFKKLITSQPYSTFDHATLAEILNQQAQDVENTSEETFASIKKLENKKSFTVTTGHQLCLFTGPLYFIYKIFSTINLAESLKKKFPEHDFIPVYWMASEDHDFAEVNHFYVNGKPVKWESTQQGAVGSFSTAELKSVLPQAKEALGLSENAKELFSIFEKSYLKHSTLAAATRFLVNALFGKYGLVTIDGDDKKFKSQFIEEFKKDIFENGPEQLVNKTVKELQDAGYHAQVSPRTINCFYIEEGLRVRIEKENEHFRLVGTDRVFSKDEMQELIKSSPEKISPNVVLRPLYQQKILPNLAYIGGPGELAYWLEFKHMFETMQIHFPILMPRNFFTIIEKPTKEKITKLGFSTEEFFKNEQQIIGDLQKQTNRIFAADQEKEKVSLLFNSLLEQVKKIDQSLEGKVAAELKKTENGLNSIVEKTNRSLRRQSDTEIRQIRVIKEKMFPGGVPQERVENFSAFYLKFGRSFFNEIKSAADPFKQEVLILEEE